MDIPAIFNGWQGWMIVAIVLAIGEMFTTNFVLLCFSIGALITSLLVYIFNPALAFQLFVFAVVSTILLLSVRRFFLSIIKSNDKEKTNVSALIGKQAIVLEDINNSESKGRVKIGGEDWSARTIDGESMKKGTHAIVVKIDGNKVIVTSKSKDKNINKGE